MPLKFSPHFLRVRIVLDLVIGIAHHAASQTFNAAPLASDVRSQPRARVLPTHTMLMLSPTTTAILLMVATLHTWATTTMAITREVEQALYHSVLVIGVVALKDASTTTSQRILIAFAAVHHDQVLLWWLTLRSPHPWALLQNLAWGLHRCKVLLDQLLMVPALLLSALVLHLLSHPLNTECPRPWVPREEPSLKWVA